MLSLTEKHRRGLLRICNCSECSAECIGESHAGEYQRAAASDRERVPPLVAGRINGRPMCPPCIGSKRQQQLGEYLTPRQAIKLGTTGG